MSLFRVYHTPHTPFAIEVRTPEPLQLFRTLFDRLPVVNACLLFVWQGWEQDDVNEAWINPRLIDKQPIAELLERHEAALLHNDRIALEVGFRKDFPRLRLTEERTVHFYSETPTDFMWMVELLREELGIDEVEEMDPLPEQPKTYADMDRSAFTEHIKAAGFLLADSWSA